jgi:DMSO/TMAO reductase YedYZ molybdopterin-dependent catalytic subunit
MTRVIFLIIRNYFRGKQLKKRLLQTLLLATAIGLILSSSLTGKFSTAASATVTSDSEWRLIVNGSNNNYLNLSLNDLAAMPKSTVYAELYCYGLIVTSGNWGGVNLWLLLNMAGVDQNAPIHFCAADGYTINLPIEDAMQEDVIIAYERDGQPLPEGLRLVVPWANGDIWIGLITSISQTNAVVPEAQSPKPNSPSIPEFPLPPQQSPAPEPRNQSTTPPVAPPSNSQPQPTPQQDSPGSSLPMEYSYLMATAIIVATATVTGYLFYKRRK